MATLILYHLSGALLMLLALIVAWLITIHNHIKVKIQAQIIFYLAAIICVIVVGLALNVHVFVIVGSAIGQTLLATLVVQYITLR